MYFMYLCALSSRSSASQKRAPDLIIDGCEPPCGFWKLNSGPLEEQTVLITTTESSLQPQGIYCLYGEKLKYNFFLKLRACFVQF